MMTELTETSLPSPQKDFPYFRRIWKNVVVALLAASFIPLILIGGGLYYYTASVLKQKTMESLRMEVINHKNSIDQFLTERTMDLKLLAGNMELKGLIRPGALENVFHSLQKGLPCFQDLGIIDDQGRHLAYVGPYELLTKNYQKAFWFKAVKSQGVYISDVFLGFRNVPHFVIAVKKERGNGFWILRATVDAAFFSTVVAGISRGDSGDAYLVNKEGLFQTKPLKAGRLMEASEFKDPEMYTGVRQKEKNGLLQVMVWLENVPWLCVVQVDRKKIFAALHRVRNIGIFVFVLGGILIVFTVLLTTSYLISRLEFKRKSIRALDQQLQQAGMLTSSMRLASGLLLNIKDMLGNIDMVARWIEDLSWQDLTRLENKQEIKKSLDELQSQVAEIRKSIDRFLTANRPVGPLIMEIDLNEMLDNLIELFDREFHFNKIRVTRDYHETAFFIRSDPSRLRQVFQNLIFNALSAIHRDGEIILKTRIDKNRIRVTVTDDGPGIPEEDIGKIFDPLYTTRPEGGGLGLSISRNIIEKLGGQISVGNEPGKGAAITVELPVQFGQPG